VSLNQVLIEFLHFNNQTAEYENKDLNSSTNNKFYKIQFCDVIKVVIIPKFSQIWLLIKYEKKKKVLGHVQKSANLFGFFWEFFQNSSFKKKKSWNFVTNWFFASVKFSHKKERLPTTS
jgi:hypothetical protein